MRVRESLKCILLEATNKEIIVKWIEIEFKLKCIYIEW